MKLFLVFLGKTRRPEIRTLLDDYLFRVRHYSPITTTELRDSSPTALRNLKLDPAARVVLLDAGGRQLTSPQFARWLGELRDRGTKEIVFLCGDAEGFPPALASQAHVKISLSTLTMQHEFARVILAEQLYRAFTILSGHPYSK